MKIGIFDSGIGGLSVLDEALKTIDDTPEYLYYADAENAPYGTKDVQTIEGYAREITRFLADKGADAVVIACNTATSAAVNTLREEFDIPIIGMEPAVKPALKAVSGTDKRVLVLATELTLKEKKFSDLIAKYDDAHKVDTLAMTRLVSFAEEGLFEGEAVDGYLDETLGNLDTGSYGAVVPGCTHFIYFVNGLKRYFPEGTAFVNGNAGTVRRLMELTGLKERSEGSVPSNKVTYYVSGREESTTWLRMK